MKKLIMVVWLIFLGSATIYGQIETPVKVGPEFQANTYTNGDQREPSTAMNSDGSSVVVWQSDGQDGNDWGIFGQRFTTTFTAFFDDFEDASIDASKWVQVSGSGTVMESDGYLKLNYRSGTPPHSQIRTAHDFLQDNVIITVKMKPVYIAGNKNIGFWLGDINTGSVTGFLCKFHSTEAYCFEIVKYHNYDGWGLSVPMTENPGKKWTNSSDFYSLHEAKIIKAGSTYTFYVDGEQIARDTIQSTQPTSLYFSLGRHWMENRWGEYGEVWLDEITVQSVISYLEAPVLSSPPNGASEVSTSPTLSWDSSSGATSYTLQVSQYSNFSSYVYNQNVGNVTSKQITGLSEERTDYWRVIASNSGGSSEWSSIWSFTTQIIEPSEHLYNLVKIYNFEENAEFQYLSISPDNQKLSICYYKGGTIYLSCFDISDKENPTNSWKVSVPAGGSFAHTFHPDSSYILNSYHNSGTLRAYNIYNGNEAHSVGGMSQPTGVVAVANRAYVITKYGNIGIVNLDNWSLLTNFNPTLNHGHYIVVGPNSNYLFYTGAIGEHNTQPTLTKLQILDTSPYLSEVIIELPDSLAFGHVDVDNEFVYVSHTNLNTSMLGFSKHRQSDLSNVYTVSLEEGISGYMKITPDNKYLFARGTNVLNIFDVDYGNKVDTLKIKASCPKFTGDGQYLYVGVNVGSDIYKLYIYKKGTPVMPPEAPTLSSPSNGATGVSTSPTLIWNSSSGATSYTLQVSQYSNFSSYVYNQNVGNVTSKQITGLSEGTTYYWRVIVSNSGGSSECSIIWSFTTVSEPCVAPDWNVNPPDYASTMTMTAQLVVFDTASTDTDDIVGAFVGEECRGVGHPALFPGTGDYVINLTVYSNTSGETVVFKAWDNSSCQIFDVDTTITFIPDADYGTAFSPIILPVRLREIEVKIHLNTGWTWFSVNASNDDMTINNVLAGLTPADGDLIKNQTGFSRYYTGYGWWGDLIDISCKEMYMIKLTSQDSLIFIGVECDITPIPLNEGWTWIGYLPQEAIVIGDALQSLTPSEGDLIKDQTGFSTYYSSTGWWGDLNNMLPFDGYKIKMASSDILIYPSAAGGGSIALAKNVNTKEALSISVPSWSVNPAAFANTMTMTAQLSVNGEISTDAGDLAGVFVGDECRGIGQPAYFPGNGTYVITLTIYSNISGETLTFKAWDNSAGQITDINETYVFQPDAIVGTAPSPFVSTSTATKIEQDLGLPKEFKLYDNYPNPFNPETAIMYQIPKSSFVTIRIYNVMGKVVRTLVNTQKDPGVYSVKWDGTNESGQTVSSGMYIYYMQAGEFTAVKKMLFIK